MAQGGGSLPLDLTNKFKEVALLIEKYDIKK